MNEDYTFEKLLIESAFELDHISESDYTRVLSMLMELDGEDLNRLKLINDELAQALEDYKRKKINDRLVIGAEKIEATTDSKEKAKLMNHYNNLLKELSA